MIEIDAIDSITNICIPNTPEIKYNTVFIRTTASSSTRILEYQLGLLRLKIIARMGIETLRASWAMGAITTASLWIDFSIVKVLERGFVTEVGVF